MCGTRVLFRVLVGVDEENDAPVCRRERAELFVGRGSEAPEEVLAGNGGRDLRRGSFEHGFHVSNVGSDDKVSRTLYGYDVLCGAKNFSVSAWKRYDVYMSTHWGSRARAVASRARRAPLLVKAGAGCGFVAGIATGLVIGPPTAGLVFGIVLGVGVGVVSGIVMERDEKRRIGRTRELDDVIGVTSGSLGTPHGSIPPPAPDERREELAAWAAEWLTPPPPATR
jgi:hypothetical protein